MEESENRVSVSRSVRSPQPSTTSTEPLPALPANEMHRQTSPAAVSSSAPSNASAPAEAQSAPVAETAGEKLQFDLEASGRAVISLRDDAHKIDLKIAKLTRQRDQKLVAATALESKVLAEMLRRANLRIQSLEGSRK